MGNVLWLMDYLKVWFAGNISAFSYWYDNFHGQLLTFGQFTFGGIFEQLNLSRREVGIYTVSYDANDRMVFTNIYTLFRFLIDDFGYIGTSFFMLGLGFISKKLFLISRNNHIAPMAILGGILAFLLFSFISSVWAYNTVFFAWLMFVFICFLLENKHAAQ